MSDNCTHDCSSCGQNCGERTAPQKKAPLESTKIKKVIGIVSGKGGVGKSSVTSMLAAAMAKQGKKVGVLDADITGPSIPKAFGITEKAVGDGTVIFPAKSALGIDIMSINLMLDNETDPVVWRGPIIGGVVEQFWAEVFWGEKDYLFVDMPPGTGDVPLTVYQSLPIDGIIIVTSPQQLVGMVVEKAANMAKMMNIPVIGIVENMSYFRCPDCGAEHSIFGESRTAEIGKKIGVEKVVRLPLDGKVAAACDLGRVEEVELPEIGELAKLV